MIRRRLSLSTLSLSVLLMAMLVCSDHAKAATRTVAFVFDQTIDQLLRIEDRNKDGDTLDAGEVTRFIDDTIAAAQGVENAQGLLALGPHEVLATDNFAPDNIVRLRDANRNGHAFDADESTVFHNGSLPGGFTLTNPVNLSRGPDDALYVIDNNTLDTANPEAVYKLKDLNGDGDVNDADEVTTHFVLSPAGVSQTTTFDIAFDNAGNGYVINISDPNQIESVDIINAAGTGIQELIDSTDLLLASGYVITFLGNELEHNPDTDEIMIVGESLGGTYALLGIRDADGSGTITSSEIRAIWTTNNGSGISTGLPRDFFRLEDGSMLFVEASTDEDRAFHLIDINGDGDYQDAGETTVLYDGVTAGSVGQPAAVNLLSVSGIALPSGDFDDNANFACADVDALVAAIAAGAHDPTFDLTGDGLVDGDDLLEWLYEAGGVELGSDRSFLVGDANLDGVVDGGDFLEWNANKFTSSASWCDGDFNADGNVDGQDFILWNANKFQSSDRMVAVPEPYGLSTVALVAMLAAVLRRR